MGIDSISGGAFDESRFSNGSTNATAYPFYTDTLDPASGFLGNFHPCSVTVQGVTFANAEAAYQARNWWDGTQFVGLPKELLTCSGPRAWELGQEKKKSGSIFKGSDQAWMRDVLAAKFSDPALRAQLCATKGLYLVEHMPKTHSHPDSYWGDGGEQNKCDGQNLLGQLLMELRASFTGEKIPARPSNLAAQLANSW